MGLGILGIFLPGLPTTPFLLLAAGLLAKSSPRLNRWLIENRYLGTYIENYQKQKGMTRKQKTGSLILMWAMVSATCLFVFETWTARIILIGVGITGTVVMGFIIRTVSDK